MTRKDYIALAECIKSALILSRITTQSQHGSGQKAIETLAEYQASMLGHNNPRFDRERFLKACGVQS